MFGALADKLSCLMTALRKLREATEFFGGLPLGRILDP